MTAAFLCAEAARLRGDSMVGTAAPGRTWILIEHRGGWPPNGFDGLGLPVHVTTAVNTAARNNGARILLIRRHGRRLRGGSGAWAVLRHATNGAHSQQWGRWHDDHDLLAIPEALARTPPPPDPDTQPVLLVCAHGQHDACCSVRGRPVARALAERWPELVWECSHVGGDRFAANIVIAPDGVYYGNLNADNAVATVEQHLSGLIHPDHLRGYTDLTPPQQTAVVAALRRFGPAGRHDLIVQRTERDEDHWRVDLLVADHGPVRVDLLARRTTPYQLTCRGQQPTSAVHYEVLDLQPIDTSS
ncbi:MAG: sucrase ferredoxin [Propionibacteriales bacterium]|nr:sucrase ferredoxin [Propionibacteriales bacterium]